VIFFNNTDAAHIYFLKLANFIHRFMHTSTLHAMYLIDAGLLQQR